MFSSPTMMLVTSPGVNGPLIFRKIKISISKLKQLTPVGKETKKLSSLILLKMAECSEA